MVGLTGNYLSIFSCHADLQQVTVMVVPGGFRLPTQAEGATKDPGNLVKTPQAP